MKVQYNYLFKNLKIASIIYFCFLNPGMGIHHLLNNKNESHLFDRLHPFQRGISDLLLPAFKRLVAAQTQVIWMDQFNMLPDQRRFFSEW